MEHIYKQNLENGSLYAGTDSSKKEYSNHRSLLPEEPRLTIDASNLARGE